MSKYELSEKEWKEWVENVLPAHENRVTELEEKISDLETSISNLFSILKEAGIKMKNPSVFPILKKLHEKEKE